jgi:hypothetical protein
MKYTARANRVEKDCANEYILTMKGSEIIGYGIGPPRSKISSELKIEKIKFGN